MEHLLFVLLIAVAGGLLLRRLRIPAAMLVSAFVAVSAWSLLISDVAVPGNIRLCAQCLSGAFVGMGLRKENLLQLRKSVAPTICLLLGYFLFTLLLGSLVALLSPLDLLTALLCATPGGISELALAADTYGAHAGAVTVLQVSRNVVGVCVFPILIRMLCQSESRESEEKAISWKSAAISLPTLIQSVLVIVLLGLLGKLSGIGAGPFLGTLLGVALLRLIAGMTIVLPNWLRLMGQLCAGLYIGSSLQVQDLSLLRYLALPAVLISGGYFLFSLVFGKVLSTRFGKEKKEALLTSTAAGASDMALIAADLGIESADLVAFQIFRWVFVSAAWPPILLWISRIAA